MSLEQASLAATTDPVSGARHDQCQASDGNPIQPPVPAQPDLASAVQPCHCVAVPSPRRLLRGRPTFHAPVSSARRRTPSFREAGVATGKSALAWTAAAVWLVPTKAGNKVPRHEESGCRS